MFYNKIPKILYHYCSIPTFFSIVNSKSLWLCNGLNMNDIYDSRYFEVVASEWLQKRKKKTSNDYERLFCEACVDVLSNFLIERPVPFVSSFSDNGDLLGQWISYANKGTGVCIGFETDKLFEYSVESVENFVFPFNKINCDDILLINVEYSKKNTENTIKRLFSSFYEIYKNNKEREHSLQEISILFCGSIYRNSALYKHAGFKEEHEWRFISNCATYFSNSKSIKPLKKDIEFACINENIKSHITLNFGENWDNELVREVILGPKFTGNEYDFEFFIKQNFKNPVIIKRSKIPYR